MARESKNGGNVKSNAAAIQSSGRLGILVSLLIGLPLLLMLDWPETGSTRAGRNENAFVQWREKFRCLEGEGYKAVGHVQLRSPTV